MYCFLRKQNLEQFFIFENSFILNICKKDDIQRGVTEWENGSLPWRQLIISTLGIAESLVEFRVKTGKRLGITVFHFCVPFLYSS
jgi:hypothetical protein